MADGHTDYRLIEKVRTVERFTKGNIAHIVEDEERPPTWEETLAIWDFIKRRDDAGRNATSELDGLRELDKNPVALVEHLATHVYRADLVVIAAGTVVNACADGDLEVHMILALERAVDKYNKGVGE